MSQSFYLSESTWAAVDGRPPQLSRTKDNALPALGHVSMDAAVVAVLLEANGIFFFFFVT